MGRPRKPTAHLELVGAFRKDPQRTRDAEPQCEEEAVLPPFPLSDAGRKCWDFLLSCSVPGVITKMDSSFIALCAESLADVWTGESVTISDRKAVGAMLGQLGMTPAERSKVVVPKKQNREGFAKYKQ